MRRLRRIAVVASGIGLAFLAMPVAQGATALTLSKSFGAAGTSLNATGSGFGAGESVRVSFDTSVLRTVTASSSGGFTTTVQVPATATPGSHTFKALGVSTSRIATATFLVRSNWLQWRYDNQHDGYNLHETGINRSNASNLVLKWSVPSLTRYADFGVTNPAVYNGRIYVASERCIPFDPTDPLSDCEPDVVTSAIDESTGSIIWQDVRRCRTTGGDPGIDTVHQLLVIGDTTCTSTGGAEFYALSLTSATPTVQCYPGSGRCVWLHYAAQGPNDTAVMRNGRFFMYHSVGEETPHPVGAFRGADGSNIWESLQNPNSPGEYLEAGRPTVASPYVYYEAQADSKFYALDINTGAVRWTKNQVTAHTAPAEGGGYVLFARGDGTIAAYNEASHDVAAWRARGDGTPAIAQGVVYAACGAGGICAYTLTTGAQRFNTNGTLGSFSGGVSDPVVANGVVYFRTASGKVVLLNSATGALITSVNVPVSSLDPPVVVNGRMLVTTTTGLRSYGPA